MKTTHLAIACVGAALSALMPTASSARQARDVTQLQTGTGVLAGIVTTDEVNNHPVRRAIVSIGQPGQLSNQRLTATDDEGRFEFTGLAAGNVTVYASKPSYVTSYYGAARPGATSGVPVAVAEGQRSSIVLRMLRGAVLTGTVLDSRGKPASAVPLRLQRVVESASGARTLIPMNLPIFSVGNTTDDRGVYRLFGLPPGDYVVSAQPRPVSPIALSNSGGGEVRQTTMDELRWAERQIQGATSSGPDIAAPPQGAAVTYANVFYPGTADAGAATVVTLAAGQEKGGVDFALQFVATAHVDGSVTNPDGQPASGVQLTLLQKSAGAEDAGLLSSLASFGIGGAGASSRTLPNGTFSMKGIEPGRYVLMARSGVVAVGRGAPPPAPLSPVLWALMDVDVAGQDVQEIGLTLAPGRTLSGRFVFEGNAPPPTDVIRLSLMATQSTGASVTMTAPPAGATFSMADVIPSTYRLTASASGWTLKSAMLGARDVADVPFEITPTGTIGDVVFTFTDAPASVSGVLYDGAGRPSSDVSIVLFAADRSLWFQGSRRLRAPARPASDGTFRFTGLPPGDYYLAALTEFAPNDWFNPQFLEQAVPAAIKIALGAGEQKKQDVRIGR